MPRPNRWTPWIPVALWLVVIALESSDLGSSAHTGSILLQIWSAIFGRPDPRTFEAFHHAVRKTGHFVGYAILSWLIFRALRSTWRGLRAAAESANGYFWQVRWSVLAMLGTLFVASMDEFHQSFDPARTSRWQDVVIDCSGALVVQLLIYVLAQFRRRNAGVLTSAS